MTIDQVALQLYTLREHLKTPTEIRASLKKVAAIGYRSVQASGLGPIGESELVSILKGEGLTLCATHEDGKTILSDPQWVVAHLHKLGCKYTAYPYPAGIDFTDRAVVAKFARDLEHAGQVLHEAGQVLTYHNHGIELLRMDGETVLRYLYDHTDPRYLQAEIDTYWIQYGGGDPVAWCESLPGRLPLLHMKDYQFLPSNEPGFAEIGSGNLAWTKIIAAAEASGCEWFIVEQDTSAGDPFDSVRKSFEFIAANLV
jgi:sugar phosphate isomerase/epimerase